MTDTAVISAIPRPLTPLIGRETELSQITDLLLGGVRLLTITGIGGIGKTRLANQVALEAEPHFTNGALMVPLAEIRNGKAILAEVAAALGQSSPGIDIAAIITMLGDGQRLLVLDNLEQIRDAGEIVAALTAAHPGLVVLSTSQVPLDIPGEYLFPLQPMSVTDAAGTPESLRESPSVALFLHRAVSADAQRTFDDGEVKLIADICNMLDGIPLAIELAAARTSVLGMTHLKQRLSNRLEVLTGGSRHLPDRLRTMRGAIEWSYGLLDPDQQRIFRYLSVHSGSIGIDAIEHTLQTLEITESALDTLDFLVTRGLLQRIEAGASSPRFRILQTIREYAVEQLESRGDEFSARLSQANFVVRLSETSLPLLSGPEQKYWYHELYANRDNIRTGAEWALEHRPELCLRIVASIWLEADFRGTSRSFITLGLQAVELVEDADLLAAGWLGIGLMQVHLREDFAAAESSLRRALTYARQTRNGYVEPRALTGLGTAAMLQERFDEAYALYKESEAVGVHYHDTRAIFAARGNLSVIAAYREDYKTSLKFQHELLRQKEQEGHLTAVARLHNNIATVLKLTGEYQKAVKHFSKAIEYGRDLDNTTMQMYSLLGVGEALLLLDDHEAAATHFNDGLLISQRTNHPLDALDFQVGLLKISAAQGDYATAVSQVPATLAGHSSSQAIPATVHCMGILMLAYLQAGDRESAAYCVEPVLGGKRTQDILPADFLVKAVDQFAATIPEDATHPERIAFEAGKSLPTEQLQHRTIELASMYLANAGKAAVVAEPVKPTVSLSPRELEVLQLIAKGHTNAEIADDMFISPRTITTHISNIFMKLDVKNRSTAVAVALDQGLVRSGA